MQIDESDEHLRNANSSIDKSRATDSNVAVETDFHPSKQFGPSFSTEEGMQIFTGKSGLPFSPTRPDKSTTSIRNPLCETQFRGKTHPDDPEKSQNALLPSVL
jgi:hypothetical protein